MELKHGIKAFFESMKAIECEVGDAVRLDSVEVLMDLIW